jgi:hypothetical protein
MSFSVFFSILLYSTLITQLIRALFAEGGAGGTDGGANVSQSTAGGTGAAHNWPDDLMDIVQEPMGHTLDRMRKYSNSMSQVPADGRTPGLMTIVCKI